MTASTKSRQWGKPSIKDHDSAVEVLREKIIVDMIEVAASLGFGVETLALPTLVFPSKDDY